MGPARGSARGDGVSRGVRGNERRELGVNDHGLRTPAEHLDDAWHSAFTNQVRGIGSAC